MKKDRYHSEISNLLTSIYIRVILSTMLALRVLQARKLQVYLSYSYDHCYMKDLTCQLKCLTCVCVSAFK